MPNVPPSHFLLPLTRLSPSSCACSRTLRFAALQHLATSRGLNVLEPLPAAPAKAAPPPGMDDGIYFSDEDSVAGGKAAGASATAAADTAAATGGAEVLRSRTGAALFAVRGSTAPVCLFVSAHAPA